MATSEHTVTEARRQSNMQTARLENHILQAIIEFNQKEQPSREQIVMALINVAGWWQKKLILTAIQRAQEGTDGH